MPPRYNPTGAVLSAQLPARTAAWSSHRFFHASPRTRRLEASSSTSNHYETLNVQPDATPAEIKKSFYHLSKRHHPDHNPSDPHAPHRFMRISEAYAILGHADKRARYDRDVMRRLVHNNNPHYNHHPGSSRTGSYHSTGPAGGRPASGLSRRRGTYQGPPPSFYRSGGWGAYGAKRRAAHEESTGTGTGAMGAGYGTSGRSGAGAGGPAAGGSGSWPGPPPPPPHPPPGGNFSGGSGGGGAGGGGFGTGGMGPGQDPFGHHDDVPHFDREAHERAQRRSDDRRAHKIARDRGVNIDQPESSTIMSFWGAAAIVLVIISGPFVISGWSSRNVTGSLKAVRDKEKEKEGKGK